MKLPRLFYRHKSLVTPFLSACILATLCLSAKASANPERPLHHTDDGFKNPYLDVDKPSSWEFVKAWLTGDMDFPDVPENYHQRWQKADKALLHRPAITPRATLLGHSTVLLQYGSHTILTDPVFSERASPVSFAGPKRYTPVALARADLPEIDIVVISHNHYDHLDADTVEQLGNKPLWIVPLGIKAWLADQDIDNAVELDWWQSHQVGELRIMATPSQHWSRRGLLDANTTLWASWAFIWPEFTAWFGGDTGYNEVQFKEIGEKLGSVDLAMIPIGAYEPRWFMRNQHVNPEESVRIFNDINARQAFGIHWNTFVLTTEPVSQPPIRLKQALDQQGIDHTRFRAINIGATWQPGD
ncbi:MAG: MBL fold metallo-hydrolase [Proteobacteria bacterium]|nr:MAG: MBL fold metallo-hydrolase [Pseudomonadota bacterium]PIE40077.1 MAG: MBL fold metallo-hydrolase [Gammaproteobacteria bacterium]